MIGLLVVGCEPDGGSNGTAGTGGSGDLCADVSCEGDGNDCTTVPCDPADGECKSTSHEDGTQCDGGQGTCMTGNCVASDPEGCGQVSHSYQDGDFADGDWVSAEAVELSEGTRSIERIETKPAGGNPGAHHEVALRLTASEVDRAELWITHALDGAVYDPGTSGEICDVRFFLDGTDQFDPVIVHQVAFSVFLEQDGIYYWAARRLRVESDTWERDAWTTRPDTFLRVGDTGPESPDFSASGAPIQFGYLNGNSRPATGLGTSTLVAGADNFRVEIFPPMP